MKHVYLKSFAESGLGRACILMTGESFPVVRVPGLSPPSLKIRPLPDLSLPVINFDECVRATAKRILDEHTKILVLWSGGMDSTLVLLALLEQKTEYHDIRFSNAAQPMSDSPPGLYEQLITLGAVPAYLGRDNSLNYIDEGFVFVDGCHADLLILHPEFWMNENSHTATDLNALSLAEVAQMFSGRSYSEVQQALCFVEPLILAMPAHLERSTLNVMWWVGFMSLWDYDEYEMAFIFGYPVEQGICFFGSDDFQRFACQDVIVKLGPIGSKTKFRSLDFIEEVTGEKYSFVKNTTTQETSGPSEVGATELFSTSFMCIYEDLTYVESN
jgi:hypothetical protein